MRGSCDGHHLKMRCRIGDADELLSKKTTMKLILCNVAFGRLEDAIMCCAIGVSYVSCLQDSDPCMVFLCFPLGLRRVGELNNSGKSVDTI